MSSKPIKNNKKLYNLKVVRYLAKHRKRLPLILYIALLTAATIYVSFRGGNFSYVLFYVVLLYPLVSLVIILASFFSIRIYQDIDGRLLYKNREISFEFVIENIGFIPISGIRLYHDEATSFRDDFTMERLKLLPGEKIRIDTKLTCKYAGGYESGVLRMSMSDMFGIMHLGFNIKSFLRVNVLPSVTDIARADVNMVLENRLYRSNVISLDTYEDYPGNELRKYAAGDPLNRVHWKNYARSGRMMVRLPDRAESDMPGLVLIPKEDEDRRQHFISRDFFLEYVISIVWYFTEQKKPLLIYYYNGGVRNVIISGVDSFQRFYMEELGRINVMPAEDEEKELMESVISGGTTLIFREADMKLETM